MHPIVRQSLIPSCLLGASTSSKITSLGVHFWTEVPLKSEAGKLALKSLEAEGALTNNAAPEPLFYNVAEGPSIPKQDIMCRVSLPKLPLDKELSDRQSRLLFDVELQLSGLMFSRSMVPLPSRTVLLFP